MADNTPDITNNKEEGQFEIQMDGGLAVLEYRIEGDRIIMPHTLVPREHRGRGYGHLLARAALDFAREQKLEVVPLCPFVAAFIQKNPEYQ